MQYSADGQSDGTATVQFPQPGFLASVFRDLGADQGPEPEGAAGRPAPGRLGAGPAGDDQSAPGGPSDPNSADPNSAAPNPTEPNPGDPAIAAHARAAALTHHRTLTVQAEHDRLADLLRRAALPVSAMDFESQLRHYEPRPYPGDGPGADEGSEPRWEDFAPAEPAAADPAPPAACWTPDTSASWPRPG